MEKAKWKKRPQMATQSRKANLDPMGREIIDSKPHPLLLASPVIPTLQEQVENMQRIGAIRRTSVLENLPDDYYGEDIEDDVKSPEGLTPHEIEGAKDYFDDKSIKSKHQTPDNSPPAEQGANATVEPKAERSDRKGTETPSE